MARLIHIYRKQDLTADETESSIAARQGSLGDLGAKLPDQLRGDHSRHPIDRVALRVELDNVSCHDITLQVLEDVEHVTEREASWLDVRDTRSECRVQAVNIDGDVHALYTFPKFLPKRIRIIKVGSMFGLFWL